MGLGGVAIVILPSIMCLKLTFSDGLGGVNAQFGHLSDFFYKMLKQISCKDTKFK